MATIESVIGTSIPTRRPMSIGKLADAFVALLAHAAVGAAWTLTSMTVMGSLGVGRRMLINSEFAFDTGRLPQPWVLPIGIAAIWVSHIFFNWSMRRVTRREAAWGPSVIAWAGVLLGAMWGAYNWPPPVVVGELVGPQSGQSRSWGTLSWVAHSARIWIPAALALITGALFLFSKESPFNYWWRRGWREQQTGG